MSDVKVVVAGCGHWGKNHVRNYAELGALAGVIDPNPATAKAMAEAHGVKAVSFDEALADDGAQGIAICAPAELHADMTVRALAAGKHVFVEKPLALTLEDGARMCAAADAAGRTLMVGHILQYHPAFASLRDLVRGGGLGALRYAYSNRLSLGKFRTEENALWSFAPHDISMLLALFGEEPSDVSGSGAAFVTKGVKDYGRLDLTFSGGRHGHVFASWLHPFKEHKLTVVGETGMAVFEDSALERAEKLRLYRHAIDVSGPVPVPAKADWEPIPYPDTEPLKEECRHFLACCAGEALPLTDGKEAQAVLEVLIKGSR